MDRLEADDPRQIGSFRLLGRLGEGGMGRVYLGVSPGNRKVAIKVVHAQHARDPEFRRRFTHEVTAARRVGGFHTAAVVEADPDAEAPWMATAYIPGPSLEAAVAERGPLNEAGARRLGAALAEGLAAIHACGIVHRDLKPSNVILADDGPRIIDFGIAKSLDATSITSSDVVIGTFLYMSPEQLTGGKVTERSDIFALGGVLTYAATGHDAFSGATIPAVTEHILHDPPNLEPLTGDLRDVISACLAREPGDRPGPAELLARFTRPATGHGSTVIGSGQPTPPTPPAPQVAQPVASVAPSVAPPAGQPFPPVTLTAKLRPVRPAPPAQPVPTPGPAVGAAVGASGGGGPASTPPAQPAPGPGAPARPAEHHRRRPLLIAAGVVVVVAAAALAVGLSGAFGGGHQQAGSSTTGSLAKTLVSPQSVTAWSVAFGTDGTPATGDRSGRVYLWNTATGKPRTSLSSPAGQQGVFSVAFGPGGILAAGDNGGRTDLFNASTGKHITTLNGNSGQVVPAVAFGPNGVLATDQVGSTDLWDTDTGQRTATLPDPDSGGVFSVAFGTDGTLATGDDNGHTYLWDTSTHKVIATLPDPDSTGVDSVAFGPNGTLASADHNGHTFVWDIKARKIIASLPDPDSTGVDSVAFGPDDTLAAGDHNGHTYLWDTSTHKVIATLPDPDSTGVDSVAFGPNGTLASADHNGRTFLWRISHQG